VRQIVVVVAIASSACGRLNFGAILGGDDDGGVGDAGGDVLSVTDTASDSPIDASTGAADGPTTSTLAIVSPTDNSDVGRTVIMRGACDSGSMVDLGGAGLASPVSTPCSGGEFSIIVAFTAGLGSKPVTLDQDTTTLNLSFNRVAKTVSQVSATSQQTASAGSMVDCDLTIATPPNIVDGDLIIGMIY
jgi:hypothetical protein